MSIELKGEISKSNINAKKRTNKTGIELVRGKKYLFEISNVKSWHDAVDKPNPIQASPFTGWPEDKKDDLQKFKKFNFVPEADYMELVGQVGKEHFRIGKIAKGVDESGKEFEGKAFEAPASGELIVRANDPRWFKIIFYGNNSGTLDLTVHNVSD